MNQSVRALPIMKRQRTKAPIPTDKPALPSSTPPSTPLAIHKKAHQHNDNSISISISSKRTRSDLTKNFSRNPKSSIPTNPKSPKWEPLNLGRSELFLPLTLPTGQTFRWKQTAPFQYTGVIKSHLVSLKQLNNGEGDVAYFVHRTTTNETDARADLLDYLNVGISLGDMWEEFSASDSRFSGLAVHLGGVRVLRQDPFECLIQFLCSSNNNIGRITRMVDFISSLGERLGTVEGLEFYKFPSLDRLSLASEAELREAGFGYRAKYIVNTMKALQSKPGGGAEWLDSLRRLDLHEVVGALSTLPGVGPKVAACIALFSLDQHHAIPVDTHVWQIATRYLIPELAGARLTPKLYSIVAEAFVTKFGKYAGWAQTMLFVAELPSQKVALPSHFWQVKGPKPSSSTDTKPGAGSSQEA